MSTWPPVIHQDVQDEVQSHRNALTLPTYTGTRARRYDPRANAYNWKAANTRKLRAGLGKAQAGTGRASWGIAGDSTSDYFVGTGNDFLGMWPRVTRSVLASLGIPVGGSGLVWAAHYGSVIDPRWSTTGTWSNANNYLVSTSAGATITFAPADTGTSIDVIIFGTTASMNWSIDSGAVTGTVTGSGGGVELKTLTTGLANTTHTITLTTTSTSASYVIAARVYGSSGLEVHNAAAYGTTGVSWADYTDPTMMDSRVASLLAVTPDVVWCALGVNDIATNGAAPTTVTAALNTLRNRFTSDFVLVGQYQPQGATQTNWEAYLTALYNLADTLDCPLLDLYDRSGGYATANANGLMGDATHPNAAAQRDWGRAAALLAAG